MDQCLGNRLGNQIHFILNNHRFRNWVKSPKTYAGPVTASVHNPVVVVIHGKLKKIFKNKKKMHDPTQLTTDKFTKKL